MKKLFQQEQLQERLLKEHAAEQASRKERDFLLLHEEVLEGNTVLSFRDTIEPFGYPYAIFLEFSTTGVPRIFEKAMCTVGLSPP